MDKAAWVIDILDWQSTQAVNSLCEDSGIKDLLPVNVAHAFHQQHAIALFTQTQNIPLWEALWNDQKKTKTKRREIMIGTLSEKKKKGLVASEVLQYTLSEKTLYLVPFPSFFHDC